MTAGGLDSTSAQSERITLRGGYQFNTSPIPAERTLFNVQLPGIIQHTLSFGASWKLTEDITLSAAWVHGFRNAIRGNIVEETGAFTRFDTQYDSIVLGLNVRFGGNRKVVSTATDGACDPAEMWLSARLAPLTPPDGRRARRGEGVGTKRDGYTNPG